MGDDCKTQSPDNHEAPTRPGSTNLDNQSPNAQTQPGSLTNFNFDLEILGSDKKELPQTPKDGVFKIQEKVLRGWIMLNQGITKRNFYFSWMFIMYLGFILVGLSTLEPQYISKTFDVPLEHMGKTTAMLYLIDYTVRLCFALLWGPMIDHFGRKFVMTIGIILVSLGFLVIPFVSFSLIPGYLIGKSLLSSGVIALSMLPFSADYIDNSTKGVMTGVNFGIGFFGGALSGILIKSCLWLDISYKTIYWMHAPLLFIVGFLLRTGVKGGNTYYKVNKVEEVLQVQSTGAKLREVKKAYKDIPWLPIANLFGILGNTDFYIMTTGLMIWVKSLIPADQDPTMIATTYQVIFFGLSVISTMVAAFKIDKISHMKIIFPVLICATIGFSIIPFTHSPYSFLVYLFLTIEGLSLPGVFIFSTYLSIRYSPSEIRGTLSGIGNCFCFLGAIIILSLGGFLHDHWRSDSSFILYGGLLLFTLITVTLLYFTKIKTKYNAKPNDTEMVRLRV